jgi:hypothetical protein
MTPHVLGGIFALPDLLGTYALYHTVFGSLLNSD